MSRDSSGNYTLPLAPVAAGTVVDPDWANDTLSDVADALTGSLPRDGSIGMTGPLQVVPRGSPLANDVVTYSQLNSQVTSQINALFPNLSGVAWSLANKSVNYAILIGDAWKIIGANAASLVITLPAPATVGNGYIVFVLGTNAATVNRNASETINGVAGNWTLRAKSLVAFICDGTNWLALEIQRANDTALTRPSLTSVRESYSAPGSVSGAVTADLNGANNFVYTLGGNITLTVSNPASSSFMQTATFVLTQDGTGGRTVTWPGTVKWPGGVAPTLSGAGKVDVVTLMTWDGGSSWLGFVGGQNF